MAMPINLDPVLSSRIKTAMSQLGQWRPDLAAQITNAMDSAHAQAMQVAQNRTLPPGPTETHSLMLAKSAMTNDADAVVSSLEAGILIAVGPDGVIWGTGKWEQFDPGWIEAFAVFLESLLPIIGGKHEFVNAPQTITIPNQVKIGIAGDWGTGEWRNLKNPAPSTNVGTAMGSLHPDITIHLGDVYYSGTADQEQHLLVPLWPRGSLGSFTLNSNHEMYSGAKPYFNALSQAPFAQQAGCSYFALENDNWIIVGLDSAYFSEEGNLYMNGALFPENFPNKQQAFLQDKGEEALLKGKKVIVLTHHNGMDDPGENTNTLFQQVTDAFPNNAGPAYWYWGHQHLGVVYQPQGPAGVRCRCCGHGALPCGAATELENRPHAIWHQNGTANDPDIHERVLNGFAMLTLDGPNIVEAFYDETGALSWSSTQTATASSVASASPSAPSTPTLATGTP
jgi:Calcineurin-like phosphoesterase